VRPSRRLSTRPLQATKLFFKVNDKAPDYWQIKFQDGDLVVEHKKTIANLSSLEYFNLEAVIPSPGLSLVTKLNLEKNREKLEEHLQAIANIVGTGEWAFEADFLSLVPQLQQNSVERLGDIYYDQAMGYLVENFKKKLQQETTKEAFQEATSERKITFLINDKQNDYWEIAFKNGAVVVTHKKVIANLSSLEYFDIEKVLPVPGTFSLIAKLNMEQNREKLQENLERITKATGQEYTFDDASLEAVYSKLNDNNKERIGSLIYDQVLGYLASNFERSLKDEMVLEAFNEIATSHMITVEHKNPTPNYWAISFKNGNIVLTFQDMANLSAVEWFNIEPLL